MGTKLPLNSITDIFATNTASLIKQNFDALSDEIDNLISRDGADPSSLTANLDANNQRIINVQTPVNNADAVNKSYVDNIIGTGGTGGGGSNPTGTTALGTTYVTNLTFDGATDQSISLNTLIEDARAGSTLKIVSPDGRPLRLDRAVVIEKPIRLDFSDTPITIGGSDGLGQGQIRVQGTSNEVTPAFQLASSVSAGANQIVIIDSPSGIDITDFEVGTVFNIRGQNGVNGNALQVDKNRFVTAVDVNNKIVTFEPVLEFSYDPTYPGSAWVPSEADPVDRTLINIVQAYPLTAVAAPGDTTVTVSTENSENFTVGDYCALFNNRIASDIAGSSTNLIDRELFIVKSVDTGAGTIELQGRVRRGFNTEFGYIEKLNLNEDVSIIGPSQLNIASADTVNREPIIYFNGAVNCYCENWRLNNIGNTVSPRGPIVRFEDALACSAHNIARLEDDESLATSGDLYGIIFALGSKDCYVDGFLTSGCRHGFAFFQSTDCAVYNHLSIADLINAGDCHGLNSYGSVISNFIYRGHDGQTVDANDTFGITISNTFHNAGDFDVTITNGIISGFNETSEAAIKVIAPSDDVVISNVHFRDCHFGVLVKNEQTVDGGSVKVMNCSATRMTAEAVYDGTNAGSNFADGIEVQGLITDGTRTGTDGGHTTIQDNDIITHTAVNYTPADEKINSHVAAIDAALASLTSGGSVWGNITGTLSAQTDLQAALDGKSGTGHQHTLSDITDAGTIASEDDAPSDGNTYGRLNGGWAVAAGGGGASVSRPLDVSAPTITVTQSDINSGTWHFVNSSSSSVTIDIPAGLTFPADQVSVLAFYAASYSNPVQVTIHTDYVDGTNGGTITATGDILQLLVFNYGGVTTIRAVKGGIV